LTGASLQLCQRLQPGIGAMAFSLIDANLELSQAKE